MDIELIFWIAFVAIYLIVFTIDMFVSSRRDGEMSVKTALNWTGLWIGITVLYALAILFFYPADPDGGRVVATDIFFKFVSGYLTEYSLSVDNLFVFIMIFSLMGVAPQVQPRLLKLGILLSIILRVLFILVGMGLIQTFHWLIYIFGALLIFTAIKMITAKDDDNVDPTKNFLYKTASKIFPVYHGEDNKHFFKKIDGKLHITSIFLVFLVIGSTDVLFAIDSIPAIIGVIKEGAEGILTAAQENFIAITSNVFAVMGLVSLFFALKGIMGMFRFLKTGVSIILIFIGLKMILGFIEPIEHFFKDFSWVSLAFIGATLAMSMILSAIIPAKPGAGSGHGAPGGEAAEKESK